MLSDDIMRLIREMGLVKGNTEFVKVVMPVTFNVIKRFHEHVAVSPNALEAAKLVDSGLLKSMM